MLVVMFPMPVPNCEFPCRCWLCFASSFSLSSFHLSTGETTLSRCKHEPCRGFVAVCCCSCDCRVCSSELKIKPPCLLVVAAAFPVWAEVMNMLSSVDFGRRSRIQKTWIRVISNFNNVSAVSFPLSEKNLLYRRNRNFTIYQNYKLNFTSFGFWLLHFWKLEKIGTNVLDVFIWIMHKFC